MPATTHAAPRCSRTPCQINQAPPISQIAATTNSTTERRVSGIRGAYGYADTTRP